MLSVIVSTIPLGCGSENVSKTNVQKSVAKVVNFPCGNCKHIDSNCSFSLFLTEMCIGSSSLQLVSFSSDFSREPSSGVAFAVASAEAIIAKLPPKLSADFAFNCRMLSGMDATKWSKTDYLCSLEGTR